MAASSFQSFRSRLHTLQSRPMTRDKSNALLLLFACAMVLLLHAGHLPASVTIAFSVLLLWRGWITVNGLRLPPHWLLVPIAVLSMASVYATHKTFFGRDVGVAMLTLLLTLKLLEMHAKRDLFVVIFLSFFLLLTNFFYSQSIGTAMLTIAVLVVLLTAQLSFQYTDAMPSLKKRIGTSMFIISLAAPLMLVLFILFPRVQGPLWGLPSDANAGRTGLSDTISPGNISELAQSDDIAFRVKFIDPPPPKSRLYWRGIVLEHYDGRAWTQNPVYARTAIPATLLTRGAPVRYQVTLEPNGRRWLFALELPGNAPTLANNKAMIAHDRQIVVAKPINDRVRYEAESYVDFILQPQESNAVLRNDLLLPRGYNPATLEFARQLRAQYSDDMQLVKAVLRFFHDEQFSYTLEPPLLGRDSVDEFLFTTRAGFCEHYASAFTVLMRAAGIPSRVVAGYQGGEINPVDGFMAVRQSDAHAWAEVWLQNRGWVRVDPTAAVAPNRIEQNLTSTLPRRTFGALNGLVNLNVGKDSLLAKLRFNWDAVTNAWNQYVLNFSPEHQINFIRKLGFDNADWHTLIMLLFAVGSITLTLIALPLIANRPKRDPVAKLYAQLSQMMSKHGYPRNMHEGPRDYCAQLTASDSLLSPEKKVAVKRFLMFYESVQYGTLDAAGNSISQLKSLLSKCR